MLVAVIGLFYSFGMRGILLLVTGFLVSGLLSYIFLSTPREAMAQKVGGFFGRINDRIESSAHAEDEDDSETRASTPSRRPRQPIAETEDESDQELTPVDEVVDITAEARKTPSADHQPRS